MLCCMLISFLQMRFRLEIFTKTPQSWNLGSLLLDFFALYGCQINYYHTGISLRNDGMYFCKRINGSNDTIPSDQPTTSSSSSSSSARGNAKQPQNDWINPTRYLITFLFCYYICNLLGMYLLYIGF